MTRDNPVFLGVAVGLLVALSAALGIAIAKLAAIVYFDFVMSAIFQQ